MEFQGENSKHDALDALLRRYLAEQDNTGLLESTGESMLAGPPLKSPSAAREADMIKRLQQRFPEKPEIYVPSGWNMRPALLIAGAAMVVISLALLWLDPLSGNATDANKTSNGLQGNGTAGEIEDATNPYLIRIDEKATTSNLTEESYPIQVVDGSPNSHPSATHRMWMRNGRPHAVIQPGVNDVRGTAPSIYPPLASNPALPYNGSAEPLDPFPLRSLYAQTSTQSRFYQLEPDKDHLIRGRKGTLLHIPKQAFVDASSGEAVTELIQVEVKEVYDRSDFLKTNLPTVSNGRQLVSGGVVLIDAIAGGRRLSLARGKDIYLEMAPDASVDATDMEISGGVVNERGELNWVNASASSSKMVPLELDKLYFDEFYCDCQGEKLWNNLLWALTDKSFANTWIATREFRQRLHALAELNYYSLGAMAYRDNVDKELWKVDRMVANMLRELVPQGLAKEEEVERFEEFARESLGKVEPFEDYGVDLSRADARRQLLFRKVGREETERLIRLDRLRREHADEIASRLVLADNGTGSYVVRVKPGAKKGSPKKAIRGFNVRQLGWLSLSKTVGREGASLREKDLKVRLTGEVPYESTRTFLTYKNMLSIVPGSLTTGQLFRFKDILRGMDAKIVAIGFKDGFPYLGIESLPRENGEQIITIAMHRLPIDEYLNALAALD